jgi:hypothetical protein
MESRVNPRLIWEDNIKNVPTQVESASMKRIQLGKDRGRWLDVAKLLMNLREDFLNLWATISFSIHTLSNEFSK